MRIIIPNKEESRIGKVMTDLYLLKVALETESKEKIIKRIDKIRDKLKKIQELSKQKE